MSSEYETVMRNYLEANDSLQRKAAVLQEMEQEVNTLKAQYDATRKVCLWCCRALRVSHVQQTGPRA